MREKWCIKKLLHNYWFYTRINKQLYFIHLNTALSLNCVIVKYLCIYKNEKYHKEHLKKYIDIKSFPVLSFETEYDK